jgi:hypothetical protein
MDKPVPGRTEFLAVGLGCAALAYIQDTGMVDDFEHYIVNQTGEFPAPEGFTWPNYVTCARAMCAHISRTFQMISERGK